MTLYMIWSPIDTSPRVLENAGFNSGANSYPYLAVIPTFAAANGVLFGNATGADSSNNPVSYAVRWDDTKFTQLDDGALGDTPLCASYDGSVLFGYHHQHLKVFCMDAVCWTASGAAVVTPPTDYTGVYLTEDMACSEDGVTFVAVAARQESDAISFTRWVDGVPTLLDDAHEYTIGAMSGDGHRVVDDWFSAFSHVTHYYWHDTERRPLNYQPAGATPRASGMNYDGSIIYAFLEVGGPTGYKPMYWDNLDSITNVTSGLYGDLHYMSFPSHYALYLYPPTASRVGTVVAVNAMNTDTNTPVVLKWDSLTGDPIELPVPSGFTALMVTKGIDNPFSNVMSDDGSIIVGSYVDPVTGISHPCYWDFDNVMHALVEPLDSIGGTFAMGVSRDGQMIWGSRFDPAPPGLKGWTVASDIEAGVGDIWVDKSFKDFADPALRNQFLAGTAWKNLGVAGELPTGTSPNDYQSIGIGEPPCYIEYGRGRNGAETNWQLWTVGDYPEMVFDDCPMPDIPPPPVTSLIAADLKITETPPDEPLVFLRYSDDAGASWSNKLAENLGREGEFANNLQWQRLGTGRYRVFELSWSCPALTALTGIFINAIPAGS